MPRKTERRGLISPVTGSTISPKAQRTLASEPEPGPVPVGLALLVFDEVAQRLGKAVRRAAAGRVVEDLAPPVPQV